MTTPRSDGPATGAGTARRGDAASGRTAAVRDETGARVPRPDDGQNGPVSEGERHEPSSAPLLLAPSGFAVVMATGIVSVAAYQGGLRAVSIALALIAAAIYVVLAASLISRVARGPRTAAEHLRLPATFGLLTLVAGTDVLARRSEIADDLGLALWLAGFALAAWLVLGPAAVRVARALGPARRRRLARGEWLNLVVATQSLAVVAGGARSTGTAVTDAGVALWAIGLVLYVALIVDVLPGVLAAWREPRRHTPDAWIVMGALAISTLAGAVLNVGAAADVTWALATAGYVWLVALEIRVALAQATPGATGRWATVFPLGMYAACSHALGFHTLGTITMAVALAAWLATAGVLAPRVLLGQRRSRAQRLASVPEEARKSI